MGDANKAAVDTSMVQNVNMKWVIGALVVVLLLVVLFKYWDQIMPKKPAAEKMACGCSKGVCSCEKMTLRDLPTKSQKVEYLSNPDDNVDQDAQVLGELGYEGALPWDEVLGATELDPSIQDNHNQFVADVRRFSSGANFTAVADDDNNLAFTNFIGLNRPQHVHIGADARQQPDIDQTVLQRNRYLRF
jgi:hypothetical protein